MRAATAGRCRRSSDRRRYLVEVTTPTAPITPSLPMSSVVVAMPIGLLMVCDMRTRADEAHQAVEYMIRICTERMRSSLVGRAVRSYHVGDGSTLRWGYLRVKVSGGGLVLQGARRSLAPCVRATRGCPRYLPITHKASVSAVQAGGKRAALAERHGIPSRSSPSMSSARHESANGISRLRRASRQIPTCRTLAQHDGLQHRL